MALHTVFTALGDPTRIAIVERLLANGEASAGDLAEPFAISKPAVSRHLRVLEEAGVIERRVDRQFRRFRVRAAAMDDVAAWIEKWRRFWNASFDRLDAHLKSGEGENPMSDDRVLLIERRFAAPPERVFDAFADPSQFSQWFGPEDMSLPDYEIDCSVGGRWRATMRGGDGREFVCSGVYQRIERPDRLVFTWGWRQPDGSRGHETIVDITLVAEADGTLLRLVQQRFESSESRDNHQHGWSLTFNDLDRFLAGNFQETSR